MPCLLGNVQLELLCFIFILLFKQGTRVNVDKQQVLERKTVPSDLGIFSARKRSALPTLFACSG